MEPKPSLRPLLLPPEVGVRRRPVSVTESPDSRTVHGGAQLLLNLACQILARLSVRVWELVSTYDSRYCKASFLVRRHIRRWDPDSQPTLNTGQDPVSPTTKHAGQRRFLPLTIPRSCNVCATSWQRPSSPARRRNLPEGCFKIVQSDADGAAAAVAGDGAIGDEARRLLRTATHPRPLDGRRFLREHPGYVLDGWPLPADLFLARATAHDTLIWGYPKAKESPVG